MAALAASVKWPSNEIVARHRAACCRHQDNL